MVSETAPSVQVTESPLASTERSPADVLRLVVAGIVLVMLVVLGWIAGDDEARTARDLVRGIDQVPSWLVSAIVSITWVLAAVVVVGGLVVGIVLRRGRALATTILAAAIAVALAWLLTARDEPSADAVGEIGAWLDDVVGATTATELLLAATMAIATAMAPWVTRRFRHLATALVIGMLLSRALVTPIELSSIRALFVGWFAGALVLVLLGAPPRRPRAAGIADGMAAVGEPLASIEQASLDARGSTPYFARTVDGRALFVKALGRDERSADLLFRMYRKVLPRDLGDERGYTSLRRAVEHEALLAFAARDLGVRTPRFVALASAEPSAFVLSYEAIDGKSLDRVDAEAVTDALLVAIWEQVDVLRSRRVAHRDLRLANVFVAADGEVWMIDFGFSELAASDTLLANDIAELLAATTLVVGPERAVSAATTVLGAATATSLDRLKPWALSGATRTALKAAPGTLDKLRAEVERETS
jgi:hypothetical protein